MSDQPQTAKESSTQPQPSPPPVSTNSAQPNQEPATNTAQANTSTAPASQTPSIPVQGESKPKSTAPAEEAHIESKAKSEKKSESNTTPLLSAAATNAQKESKNDKEAVGPTVDELIEEGLKMDNKLNLSLDEKENDEDLNDEQITKEFNAFMKEMSQGGGADVFTQLNQMLQGIDDESKMPFNDNELDGLAANMLNKFMEKDIILEPLIEAREKLKKFIDEKPENVKEKPKLKVIEELIEMLEKDEKTAESKEKMVKKFEELQDLGGIPKEILDDCAKENPDLQNQLNKCPVF